MKKNRRESQGRAFSLTEMLVAGGIIAVIASLAIPSVFRSIEEAKTAKGIGTMKALLACASQAQLDYGAPYYRKLTPNVGRMYFFQYYTTEYCGFNEYALRSPFDTNWDQRVKATSWPLSPSDKKVAFSYSMNRSLPQTAPDPVKEPSLVYPNALAMQTPSHAALYIESMGTVAAFYRDADLATVVRFPYKRGAATAVGYMDYHIELVNKSDLIESTNSSWSDQDRNMFWTGSPSP